MIRIGVSAPPPATKMMGRVSSRGEGDRLTVWRVWRLEERAAEEHLKAVRKAQGELGNRLAAIDEEPRESVHSALGEVEPLVDRLFDAVTKWHDWLVSTYGVRVRQVAAAAVLTALIAGVLLVLVDGADIRLVVLVLVVVLGVRLLVQPLSEVITENNASARLVAAYSLAVGAVFAVVAVPLTGWLILVTVLCCVMAGLLFLFTAPDRRETFRR